MKYRVITCMLLCLFLCLAAACAETAWDTAFTGGSGRLEQVSLYPADFAGFTANIPAAGAEPVRTDEYGTAFYALSGEAARELFYGVEIEPNTECSPKQYYGSVPISAGPDGAVLWAGIHLAEDWQVFLFVQRDHEIVILTPDESCGAPDAEESVQSFLDSRYDPENIQEYNRYNPAEWTADGRYVSLYTSLNIAPPFLLDTRTGAISAVFTSPGPADFLAENGLEKCRAEHGHISADGQSLDLSLICFHDSVTVGDTTETAVSFALARYDIASGSMAMTGMVPEPVNDFSDLGDGRMLADGPVTRLVAPDGSGTGQAAELPGSDLYRLRAYGGTTGPAVTALQDRQNNLYEIAFTADPDPAGADSVWYMLPADAEAAGPWEQKTLAEIRALLEQPAPEDGSSRDIARYRRVRWVLPVRNTPYLLLVIPDTSDRVATWPDNNYTSPNGYFLLLDTETMASRLLQADRVWTYEFLGKIITGASDPVICGNTMIIGGTAFRLDPEADPAAGAGSAADPVFRYLDSLELDDGKNAKVESIGAPVYMVSDSYRGILACTRYPRMSIPGYDVDIRIGVRPDSYGLVVTFEEIKPPLVPEVLTEERAAELKERMSKKDFSKKFITRYKKYTPDGPESTKAMKEKYPALKDRTLYILTEDARRERNMRDIAALLAEYGYTEADYAGDMQYAPNAEANTGSSSGTLGYELEADGNVAAWMSGPVAGLLNLSDYLAGTAYTQYITADPRPDSAGSLPVEGTFTFEHIPYRVALDSVREDGGETVFTFTAVPEGGRGWLQTR